MPREHSHLPNDPIEEWTDAELVARYRSVAASPDEVLGESREKAALVRLSQEMRRRGLQSDPDELRADVASPGGED